MLITVVRYRMELAASLTMRTLAGNFAADPSLALECRVLLWDNSPTALKEPAAPFAFEYRHAQQNAGVSGAYNGALESAEQSQIPWLMLLDQDTHLPAHYVRAMLAATARLEEETDLAAIVPFVRSEGVQVSPRFVTRFLRSRQVPRDNSGRLHRRATAVNSGSVMRVSALRAVGGYSDRYWLDLSDTYVFHRMYAQGYKIYVCPGLELEHSIATLNYDRDMTPARYENFLAAENSFADELLSRTEGFGYTLLLFLRAQRQRRRLRNRQYARLTWKAAWFRLLHGPAARARRWEEVLRSRNLPAVPPAAE